MHGNSVILFCWLCTLPNCCWYFSMIFWPLQTYWNNSIYQLKKYRDIIKLLLLLSFFPPFWTNIRRLQIVSQKVYGLLISHWCFCENSFPLHFLFWFILKGLNNWETWGKKTVLDSFLLMLNLPWNLGWFYTEKEFQATFLLISLCVLLASVAKCVVSLMLLFYVICNLVFVSQFSYGISLTLQYNLMFIGARDIFPNYFRVLFKP